MDASRHSDTCGVRQARVRLSVGACAVVLGITRALLLFALRQRGLLLGASYWDLCATWAVPVLAARGGTDGRCCDQVWLLLLPKGLASLSSQVTCTVSEQGLLRHFQIRC